MLQTGATSTTPHLTTLQSRACAFELQAPLKRSNPAPVTSCSRQSSSSASTPPTPHLMCASSEPVSCEYRPSSRDLILRHSRTAVGRTRTRRQLFSPNLTRRQLTRRQSQGCESGEQPLLKRSSPARDPVRRALWPAPFSARSPFTGPLSPWSAGHECAAAMH